MAFQVSVPIELPQELVDELVERVLRRLSEHEHEPGEPDPYMTVEHAAGYYDCTERRIRDLYEQGRLQVVRDGRRVLTRRSWLDAALDK